MTHEELKELLLKHRWKNTSTFKTAPHQYTLDDYWEDQDAFLKCWNFINDNGREVIWGRRLYKYYDIGEHYYWSMPKVGGKGKLINRSVIKRK